MASLPRKLIRLALGALLVAGVSAAASPATAAPSQESPFEHTAQPEQTTEPVLPDGWREKFNRVEGTTVSPSDDEIGTLDWVGNCFGNLGWFRDGTDIIHWDWQTDVNECFGIAPNRTIWHTWPRTDRWHEMPGDGRADQVMPNAWEDPNTGVRTIQVYVAWTNRPYWCNTYFPQQGNWSGWWHCT